MSDEERILKFEPKNSNCTGTVQDNFMYKHWSDKFIIIIIIITFIYIAPSYAYGALQSNVKLDKKLKLSNLNTCTKRTTFKLNSSTCSKYNFLKNIHDITFLKRGLQPHRGSC